MGFQYQLLLAVAYLIICTEGKSNLNVQPKAKTESGVVVGKYVTSRSGNIYRSFEGIPYARPPVGDNRFKEPQPLEKKWLGEWNATQPGSPCLQYNHFSPVKENDRTTSYLVKGDEDCLFLNVYVSGTEEDIASKDVIVYIHGGAFQFGISNAYSPFYLMDHTGIIYVSINYRLGPLGFLSTGDSFAPGNNGLKDQVAALQWIQRNIAAFGGDPNRVTITGLSAGGASVHYMYLSPLANGLFQRGYSYSGTALCPWALVKDVPEKTKKLAGLLGCPTGDSKFLVKCLRRRPANQIVEQMKNFQTWLYNPFTVFGPVVEIGSPKPFIDQHPIDIILKGQAKDLPWIQGVTSEEGLYPAAEFVENEELLYLKDNWDSLASIVLFFNDTYPQTEHSKIASRIKQAYLKGKEISKETTKELVQMIGDRLFVVPAIKAAILQAQKSTQPIYFYRFSRRADRSLSSFLSYTNTNHGVCHADDIGYVIQVYEFDPFVTDDDKKMGDILTDMLLSFAKTGKVPANLKWEPLSANDDFKYLEIASLEDIAMKKGTTLGNLRVLSEIFSNEPQVKDEL